jgi:hypothetical protein
MLVLIKLKKKMFLTTQNMMIRLLIKLKIISLYSVLNIGPYIYVINGEIIE